MKERILIVDDEERIRKLIGAYLKKEGYEIVEAENGFEALDIFKKQTIHLVILDIMMPIIDGWSTCRELRNISTVPIVMLTAKSENDDKLLGFELGADHYISKPFDPRLLAAKVKALIRRTYYLEQEHRNEICLDGLRIDELSHDVTLNQKKIYLTPKEYELLLYIAINRNIVLTRDQILDHVWGIDFAGDFRTVDSHIKRLREKLEDKAYLISTIRGIGYKFSAKDEE